MEDVSPISNKENSQHFLNELNSVANGEVIPQSLDILDEQKENANNVDLKHSSRETVLDLDNPLNSIDQHTNPSIPEASVVDNVEGNDNPAVDKSKIVNVVSSIGKSITPRPQKIDPSGGAFLGSFKTEKPVENAEDISKNPFYESLMSKMDSLIQRASGPIKTKLQVFKEFKVKHQKTFESISTNLSSIESLVSADEYKTLKETIEEGSKTQSSYAYDPDTYKVKNPTLEEEKLTWQVPDRKPQSSSASLPPIPSMETQSSQNDIPQIPEESTVVPAPETEVTPSERTQETNTTSYLYDEPIGPINKTDLSPEESEKIEREMRATLDAARESFAVHEADYKTKVREGKKMFRSVMEKLGAPGKQRPPLEREAEHAEAEKAYLEAKWNLRNFISGRNIKEIEGVGDGSVPDPEGVQIKKIDVGVFEQAEKEYRLLQDRLREAMPEKEKSTIEKCFQKWNSLPLAQRVVLSSALLTAGGVALGTVGVSGALAALGWRATRAFVGTNIGLAAGKMYGNAKEKEITEKREEYLNEYGSNSVREKDQFIEEEKNLDEFFKNEKGEMMKNQIKKGLVTAAVAGVSTVGLGMAGQAVMGESAPSSGKVSGNTMDTAPKPKAVDANTTSVKSWFDKFVTDNKKTSIKLSPAQVAESSPQRVDVPFDIKGYEPVGVELSDKGFIDTVSQLKENLQDHNVSPAVQKLLSQSPEKIAMDLGLYKPGEVAESAFGLQGEELTMNANGDIALMHNDGSVNILFDASGKAG